MKRALALILAAIMLMAAFAACGDKKEPSASSSDPAEPGTPTDPGSTEPEAAPPYGTFHTYATTFATTLSTLHDTSTQVSDAASLMTTCLYNDKASDDRNHWEWVCELAADWPQQMDAEGRVWRIPLKQGYKWSNGDPITAHDYEYSLKLTLDPKLLSLNAPGWINSAMFVIQNCKEYNDGTCSWEEVGVKVIDDYTIEVTATKPVPKTSVIRQFTGPTLYNEKFMTPLISADGTSTTYGTSIDKCISSGPFILTEWVPDARFVFTRNPDYVRADEIHLENYVISYVPDSQTAIELFQTYELDYCALQYSDWESFEDDPRVCEYFNDSLMYMFVNTGNPNQNNLLGKLNFRKALYYGTDRQMIADTIRVYPATRYVRKAVVGNIVTGEPFVDIPQDYVLSTEESYDPAKAKEYFNKALEECNLTSASFHILRSESTSHTRAVTEILQKMWPENLGTDKLTVEFKQVPSSQIISLRRFNPDDPDAYDTTLGSMLPSSTDVRDGFKFFLGNYSPPRFAWKNEEFDRLYAESLQYDLYTESDKIIEYSHKLEKILLDELVVVPIYERPEKVIIAENCHLPVDKYVVGFGFGFKYMWMD